MLPANKPNSKNLPYNPAPTGQFMINNKVLVLTPAEVRSKDWLEKYIKTCFGKSLLS
jgi:hypothetical protein